MFRNGDCEEVGRPEGGHLRWAGGKIGWCTHSTQKFNDYKYQPIAGFSPSIFCWSFCHVFRLILVLHCPVLLKYSRTDSISRGLFWHQILVYLYCCCAICLITKHRKLRKIYFSPKIDFSGGIVCTCQELLHNLILLNTHFLSFKPGIYFVH